MKKTTLATLAFSVAIAATTGSALAADGEKLFKTKCGTCHSMEAGKHKVGPSLAGVMGRQAGATDFGKC